MVHHSCFITLIVIVIIIIIVTAIIVMTISTILGHPYPIRTYQYHIETYHRKLASMTTVMTPGKHKRPQQDPVSEDSTET